MAIVSVTAAIANQVATAAFWNNTINAILNQVNGNLDEENIRDGVITAAKLANGSVDLSGLKVTGNLPVTNLNSGTSASSTTFWRGDATWADLAGNVSNAFLNLNVTRPSASTVTVTVDELVVAASATSASKITSVNVTADITASGANGLDSGAEAADTIYYIWVIRKSSDGTVAALLSTSATSPTLPADFDQKALLSVVGNDNSSDFINFSQDGRIYNFIAWPTMASGNVGIGTWVAIDLTPSTLTFFVPSALSTRAFGTVSNVSASTAAGITSDQSVAESISTADPNKVESGNEIMHLYWEFDILTADTLYWASDGAGNKVFLGGFFINQLM